MKNLVCTIAVVLGLSGLLNAQGPDYNQQMQAAVARFDKAIGPAELQQSATDFMRLANAFPKEWLTWYYAAACNARIGFLYQDDGDKIEPFSNDGERQIKKAESLLDSSHNRKEMAEVYCVMSMVYRTKVFINPMTYGRQYGTRSEQYLQLAKRLDPENPRTLYLEGWVKYNTPKMWGGDKALAKTLLGSAAAKLQAASTDGITPHWGKTEVQEMLKKYK